MSPYDIGHNYIPDTEEAERALVYAVRIADEWVYVPPDIAHGEDVSIPEQCQECGNGQCFVAHVAHGRPNLVECSEGVTDGITDTAGCGAIYRVSIRPCGNERDGVVMP